LRSEASVAETECTCSTAPIAASRRYSETWSGASAETPAGVDARMVLVHGLGASTFSFRYTIPANERGVGGKVDMRLMGDEAVQVAVDNGQPQVWSRCRPVS